MADVPNPHDRFFREVLSRREAAQDFVRHYLPREVASSLDLDTLEITRDSFVDPDLRIHLSDLVYRVELLDGAGAYLYLLFEHKSYPDPFVGFQLLRYMTRLWDQVLKQGQGFPLPAVIPIVLYHGRVRWQASAEFSALVRCPGALAPYVPAFRYALTDLSRYTDDEIRGNAILQAGLLALRHIFDEDLGRTLPRILQALQAAVHSTTGLEALEAVLRYLASASERLAAADVQQALNQVFEEQGEKIMPTLAERWIQEGKQQGLQQGLQQGVLQGAAATAREAVAEALEARFEVIPRSILERIEEIEDVAVLKMLLKRAITADSPEAFRKALEIVLS